MKLSKTWDLLKWMETLEWVRHSKASISTWFPFSYANIHIGSNSHVVTIVSSFLYFFFLQTAYFPLSLLNSDNVSQSNHPQYGKVVWSTPLEHRLTQTNIAFSFMGRVNVPFKSWIFQPACPILTEDWVVNSLHFACAKKKNRQPFLSFWLKNIW